MNYHFSYVVKVDMSTKVGKNRVDLIIHLYQ